MPLLTDGVVTLRCQHPDDLELHLAAVDQEQMRWLWEPGHREPYEAMTPEERRAHQLRHLHASHDSFGPGPKWSWSVDLADARYVAYVDCDLANHHVPVGEANISYVCSREHRGKGYTSRAVRLVCDFLRQRTKAQEAHILVDGERGLATSGPGARSNRGRDFRQRARPNHPAPCRRTLGSRWGA